MIRALPLALASALACDVGPPAAHDAATGDEAVRPDSTPHAPAAAAAPAVFTQRTAVFLLADSAELAWLRAEYGADFETVADDMMWYRAEALAYLERHDVPVVYFEGRPAIRFRVHGREQRLDFGGVETAEVVILYEPDSVPRAIAPVDVPAVAAEYFRLLP